MSGWIKEKEKEEAISGAAEGQGEEGVVSGGDALRVTSSEPLRCSLAALSGKYGEEETRQLKEEVVRLEEDLVELRSKYKKVRAEKRELRRRLASVSNEKQVIEVVTSGGGGQGDSKESAVGDFEKLRLANDQKVLEVEALVDGVGLEAKRLREEKEELQEELRDTQQR